MPQVAQFSYPSHTTSVTLIPLSEHEKASNKLEWQALQHLIDVLLGLPILDLLSGRTWTVPGIFAFIHDCTIDTKTRKNTFMRISGHLIYHVIICSCEISSCLRFCCTNNKVSLHVRMKRNTKGQRLASFVILR